MLLLGVGKDIKRLGGIRVIATGGNREGGEGDGCLLRRMLPARGRGTGS